MVKANPHFRILISLISLTFLALFYYFDVRLIDRGVGYGFLGLFVLSVFAIEIKNPFLSFYTIRRNLIIVALFLIYLTVREILDSQSLSGIFGFMMGTTSGVFFAFGLGILVSYVFCNIYNTLITFPDAIKFFKRYALIYFLLSLWFVITLFIYYFSQRIDLGFRIDLLPNHYQRPGIWIFLFNIQNAILYAISKSFIESKKNYFSIFFYSIAILTSVLAQLIGSNFAFVGVLLLIVTMLTYGRLLKVVRLREYSKELSLRAIFIGWMFKEILIVVIRFTIISILILYLLTELSLIDLTSLRFFSPNWAMVSISARIKLVQDLFIDHFNYSPIFGNMSVNQIMLEQMGTSQYVHSLLSLFPHLGITGVILFLIMVYFVFSDIKRCGKFANPINYEYQLLRLLMMTFIFFIALMVSFIDWIPLWFVFGLFSASFIRPDQPSAVSNIK